MSPRLTLATLATAVSLAHAGDPALVIQIGDADGFGLPGAFDVESLPGPDLSGTLVNEVMMDQAILATRATPVTLVLEFDLDLNVFASVSTASVEVIAGSVGRRSKLTGYGFAPVSASFDGDTAPLGEFLTTSTGARSSAAEEAVRTLSFDVGSLLSAGDVGVLTLTVDGSGLQSPDPSDLFGIDVARLIVTGVSACAPADLASPVGVLDIADVVAFLGLFGQQSPVADLAAPMGTFDIADVVVFLQRFGAGCP